MAIHTETKWLASDGTPMHAVRWQTEGEPSMVVCLIHGLGEHSGRYATMAEYYVSHGVEVVSFDLRGHGRSDGQRGHCDDFQQMVRDIEHFLYKGARVDLEKPHFIYGHSLGGTLALKYILSNPGEFKGVILSAPMFKPAFEPPKWKVVMGRYLQSIWPTLSLSNEVDRNALTRDKALLASYKSDPLNHDRISAKFGTQLLEEGEGLLQDASLVNLPMLMMHGDADELTCHKASILFADCAGQQCTLKIWEDFYHELHHEPKKEDVFDYSIAWMKGRL